MSGSCFAVSPSLSRCFVFDTHDFDRVRRLENELLVAANHRKGLTTLVKSGESSREVANSNLRVELLLTDVTKISIDSYSSLTNRRLTFAIFVFGFATRFSTGDAMVRVCHVKRLLVKGPRQSIQGKCIEI